MTKRKLYIHIGVQRTATTSIQRFLSRNHRALRDQGFLQFNGMQRHQPLFESLFDGSLSVAEAAARLTQQADAAPNAIHSINLSEEDICSQGRFDILAQFQAFFDLKVVVVLRRQDLWLESWYRQNIKWQWQPKYAHLRFDDFLSHRADFSWVHYDALLARLEAALGQDAVLPLVFEPAQMPDGPLRAYCAAVGITKPDALDYVKYKSNASPSPLMGEFIRHLPMDELPDTYRLRVERACLQADRAIKAAGPQSALYMDAGTRQTVLAEYAQGNARLARRYFDRAELFTQSLPDPDAPLAPQALPNNSQEIMTTFVAPMLRELIGLTIEAETPAPKSKP